VKLLLNEMWSSEIARRLRARGVDAAAATELPFRYRGVPDHDVFSRAREDGRAIVTDNVPDFATLVADAASRGEEHPGVIFAVRPAFDRANPRVVGRMVRALEALVASEEASRVAGGAVFLRRR
jgi:predicted nuclease of predicted toxin-antitoxin system